MKLSKRQLRKLVLETILRESVSGQAREYSMKNPDATVHLYDSEKGQVIVIKDGEDKERIDVSPGTKQFKNLSANKTGSAFSDEVKAFGFV